MKKIYQPHSIPPFSTPEMTVKRLLARPLAKLAMELVATVSHSKPQTVSSCNSPSIRWVRQISLHDSEWFHDTAKSKHGGVIDNAESEKAPLGQF
jgi:hypothetical protein